MVKRVIFTDKATHVEGLSQGFRVGDFIYTSGITGRIPNTNEYPESVADRTRMALEKMKAVLEAEGASMDNVIKTTVFLPDVRDFQEMNEVYKIFFTEPYPARSCVGTSLVRKEYKVEIEAVAYAPKK